MHRLVRRIALLCLIGLVVLGPNSARANLAACGQTDNTWVNVRFLGRGWSKKTADAVMAELKTDLAKDGIAICAEVPDALVPPVAVVELSADEPSTVVISIQVRDKVTAKRVGRDTDVSALPPDGRPLALAAAADELLRVTWAELALRNVRSPVVAAPELVLRAAQATVGVPRDSVEVRVGRAPYPELGARFAVQRFIGGQTLLGGDAFVRVGIAWRAALELGAGARTGLTASAAHGIVHAHTWCASAALVAPVYAAGRWIWSAGAGVQTSSVSFRGDANSGAVASAGSSLMVLPYAFASASMRVLPGLRVSAELGGGAPLRGVEALDDGQHVTGVTGVALFGGATVGIGL